MAQLAHTRQRMGSQFNSNQVLGRTQTIGCVAIEITQKCNLDCTICYLSENSQSVRDIPLSEVLRRLDLALEHYGPGCHVQITGGEPTLRKHHELIEIVRYARQIGLYPALFTNGIAASSSLLKQLTEAGLCEVAFHVDTTQKRPDYDCEAELDSFREELLERCRGLDLMVIFNTTVHRGNIDQIPGLLQFFIDRADQIGFCSFQLQADTGRGEWRERATVISQDTIKSMINGAAGQVLPWGVVQIGHRDCHSYLPTLVVNRRVYPIIEDQKLLADFLHDFAQVDVDRHHSNIALLLGYGRALLRRPRWWPRTIAYVAKQLRCIGGDLWRGRGQVEKLSFFVQDFMHAGQLNQERVDACSFMVMTADGPVSMCQHNAHRDDYILQPLNIIGSDGHLQHYDPLPRSRHPQTQPHLQTKEL